MKKFVAMFVAAVSVVSGAGVSSEANACDGKSRIVYVQSSPVVRSISVVRAQPAQTTHAAAPSIAPQRAAAKPKPTLTVVSRKLVEIENGSTVSAKVRFAGKETGEVTLRSGDLELQCKIVGWTPTRVAFELPTIEAISDVEVTVTVFSATGKVVKKVGVMLVTEPHFVVQRPASNFAK